MHFSQFLKAYHLMKKQKIDKKQQTQALTFTIISVSWKQKYGSFLDHLGDSKCPSDLQLIDRLTENLLFATLLHYSSTQASAYEVCDHTHTPLHMPKTLETCRKKHILFDKCNLHQCNLHYAAILMMTSQILKSAGFTKTQKS